MTVGTINTGGISDLQRYYRYKTWSGSDGKYELIGTDQQRIKFNPYSLFDQQHYVDQVSTWTDPVTGRPLFINAAGYVNPGLPTLCAKNLLKAQNKLVSKVRNNDFNLVAFAGEYHQTNKLVTNNLRTIGSALVYNKFATSRSQMRKVYDLLGIKGPKSGYVDDVSKRWLEAQYGWLPLIDDVYNASLAFAESSRNRRAQVYKVGSQRVDDIDYSDPNSTIKGKRLIKTKISYEFTERLNQKRALGLTNPLNGFWELVPYSFVIDWFLPIGDYFDSLAILPALDGRWVQTLSQTLSVSGTPKSTGNPLYKGAKSHYTLVEVSRTVGTGFSAFNVPLPRFKDPSQVFSGQHIANAVALFHQLLLGKSAPRGISV